MPAWIPIIAGASAAYGAIKGGKEQKKADNLSQQSLDMSREQYADRAPFRQYATDQLNATRGPINSASLFQDAGNPYASQYDYTQDMGALPAAAPAPAPRDPRLIAEQDAFLQAMQRMSNRGAPEGLMQKAQASYNATRGGMR